MNRYVGVLAPASVGPLEKAMFDDVVDLVEDITMVHGCILTPKRIGTDDHEISWRGMQCVAVPDGKLRTIVRAMAAIGADEVSVVVPDVPDLPALLLGKLHSALTTAEVAVCPAEDGRLVAAATRFPVADWVPDFTLDDADALDRLYAAAPRAELSVGPGWHRVSSEDDARRLDRGLEGWERTRALLGL